VGMGRIEHGRTATSKQAAAALPKADAQTGHSVLVVKGDSAGATVSRTGGR